MGAICPNQHHHLGLDQHVGGNPRPPVLSTALLRIFMCHRKGPPSPSRGWTLPPLREVRISIMSTVTLKIKTQWKEAVRSYDVIDGEKQTKRRG